MSTKIPKAEVVGVSKVKSHFKQMVMFFTNAARLVRLNLALLMGVTVVVATIIGGGLGVRSIAEHKREEDLTAIVEHDKRLKALVKETMSDLSIEGTVKCESTTYTALGCRRSADSVHLADTCVIHEKVSNSRVKEHVVTCSKGLCRLR